MLKWRVYLIVMVIAGLLVVVKAFGHMEMVDACFKGPMPTKKIGEQPNENGTLSEVYDRNGDGQIDLETISPIQSITKADDGTITYDHSPYPLLIAVDTTMSKGDPDIVYINRGDDGRCSQLVVYKNLTVPHMPDEDSRSSASGVSEP